MEDNYGSNWHMSKITFRADEELVERIEARDSSKSEIMREALREYLDRSDSESYGGQNAECREATTGERLDSTSHRDTASLDALLAERVDELVAERLTAWETRANERAQDVNVNVTVDGAAGRHGAESEVQRNRASDDRPTTDRATDEQQADRQATSQPTESTGQTACGQCGNSLSDDHVYCPNCGEKAARRVFCECGDEVRSDWGFCPGCGRRTPAADVLDQS